MMTEQVKKTTEYLSMRSSIQMLEDDIFIRSELVDAYQVLERQSGYARLKMFWGLHETEGWFPEVKLE